MISVRIWFKEKKLQREKYDKPIGLRLRTSILVDVNLVSTAITIQRKKKGGTIQETTYHQKAFLGNYLACLQLQGN